MKLKTNDNVKILSGKDRGKTGKIIQVFSAEGKIVVEGVNKIKRHLKAKGQGQSQKGQVLELSAPIPASRVALICPKCSQPIRVGYKTEAGVKKRVCRKCKEYVD
ncbi:MAG: 50S ribosomal protein L24 [Candidatus Magasanikbacteria bacterium]|nr:50S ribosomal protein L24 [Candidatus Magasanikbacteria bacterium]